MKFITIATWEPHHRDEMMKRRKENGRMLPKGVKLIGEWVDASGGRSVSLYETDSALEGFKWSYNWSDIHNLESFPVLEVIDDKGSKLME
jgi:hypothetical protein